MPRSRVVPTTIQVDHFCENSNPLESVVTRKNANKREAPLSDNTIQWLGVAHINELIFLFTCCAQRYFIFLFQLYDSMIVIYSIYLSFKMIQAEPARYAYTDMLRFTWVHKVIYSSKSRAYSVCMCCTTVRSTSDLEKYQALLCYRFLACFTRKCSVNWKIDLMLSLIILIWAFN